jgi:lipoate-protein ligase A
VIAAGWTIERLVGDAAALHAREPTAPQRHVAVAHAYLREQGIDLVRRRTGGGAVLLVPGEHSWIDIVLARHDPLVVDDVGRSFGWLGATWVAALAEAGHAARLHEGPLVQRAGGPLLCFGGLGPGEVLLGERKVVGLSQRRTREVVRLQCLVHHVWRPDQLLACFEPSERLVASDAIAIAAAAVPVPAARLLAHLLDHLPS